MNLKPLFAAAGLALCMTLSGAAAAAPDPSHFLLTPALMTKLKAMEPEAAKAVEREGENKGMNVETADDLQRQIDGTPALRQLVAKHGFTSEEYAAAMFATLHAGMHMGFESAMGKKGAADAMASYTQEQRANIDLMRTLYAPAKH